MKEVTPEANFVPVSVTDENLEAEEGVVIFELDGILDMLGVVEVKLIVR